MANYHATARSNVFHVTDPDAFTAALADLDIEVVADDPEDRARVFVLCHAEGGWPGWRHDEEKGEDIDVDVPAIVAAHLSDGQVAVFLEAGADKFQSVCGAACAVNNRGGRVALTFDAIYDHAADLGEHIARI